MLIRRFIIALAFVYPLVSSFPLKAQNYFSEPPSSSETKTDLPSKLRVGFAGGEPAVIVSGTGKITGITVEMWHELAEKLNLNDEMVFYSSVPEMLVHLGLGKIDVAFGTISITPERLELFDFTQPVGQDHLTLLLPSSPPTLWGIVRPFLGWAFISSAGVIYLCLFTVGNLLWLAEHKDNPEQFTPEYFKGIKEGMWCAVMTFTTVGYGDRYPITPLGRIIASWWAIISTIIVSSLTAGIATTLALAFSPRSVEEFSKPQDLNNARIAVITGSNAAKWATYYGARLVPIKDLASGITQLKNKQVDAILYSRLFLENYLHQNPQIDYRMANFSLGTEYYSIALTANNPLTKKLNEQLFNIDTQIKFQQIADNWFQFKNDDSRYNNPGSSNTK